MYLTIKRYLAKDMNEAMTRIKYELGSNAVIISSRWIRKKGIKNLFSKKVLEVTAAVDEKYSRPQPAVFSQPPVQNQLSDREQQLEKEIKELREMVGALLEKEKARQKSGRKIQFSTLMQRHLKTMDLDEEIIKAFREYCRKHGNSKIDYNSASQYFEGLLE